MIVTYKNGSFGTVARTTEVCS